MLTSSGAHSCQCSSGSDFVLCLSLSLLMQTLYWSWWLVVILSGSKPVKIFQLNSPSGNPHFRSSDVFTVTSFAILPSFPWPTPQPPRKNKGNWSSEAMSEEEPLGGRFITYPCNLLQYSFRFDFSIACPRWNLRSEYGVDALLQYQLFSHYWFAIILPSSLANYGDGAFIFFYMGNLNFKSCKFSFQCELIPVVCYLLILWVYWHLISWNISRLNLWVFCTSWSLSPKF